MIPTMIAIGSTMRMLKWNLSLNLQPCDWVATMVVSEMKLRLSPKNAPPITAAAMMGKDIAVRSASKVAIGISATIVPMPVPMQSETTQAEKKSPASA